MKTDIKSMGGSWFVGWITNCSYPFLVIYWGKEAFLKHWPLVGCTAAFRNEQRQLWETTFEFAHVHFASPRRIERRWRVWGGVWGGGGEVYSWNWVGWVFIKSLTSSASYKPSPQGSRGSFCLKVLHYKITFTRSLHQLAILKFRRLWLDRNGGLVWW